MLNLVIDIGNSRSKIAIFNRDNLMINFSVDELKSSHLELLKTDHPNLEKAIISSVKERDVFFLEKFHRLFRNTIELDLNTPIPLQNCYETPETLGKDRLAAAVGANWLFPKENLIVVDAGTAVTYDFVNKQNQYWGGFITPGLTMRLKALNQFTQKLPLLEPQMPQKYS
jgi:type III pantothenate kinase